MDFCAAPDGETVTPVESYAIPGVLGFVSSVLSYALGYYMHGRLHGDRHKRELSESYSRIERVMRLEEEQRLVELCRECRTPLVRVSAHLKCAECEREYTQTLGSGTYRA